jgi:orotate phosphoribosyltransferase
VDDRLRELGNAREGHFLLESGHHGPLWLELDALFLRPDRITPLADALADQLAPVTVDVLCGPLVGGAFLAHELATRLRAKSVFSERTDHTPGTLHSATYEVPAALRPALQDARVAVVDDVVNAGSRAAPLPRRCGQPVATPWRSQRCCDWGTAPSPSLRRRRSNWSSSTHGPARCGSRQRVRGARLAFDSTSRDRDRPTLRIRTLPIPRR